MILMSYQPCKESFVIIMETIIGSHQHWQIHSLHCRNIAPWSVWGVCWRLCGEGKVLLWEIKTRNIVNASKFKPAVYFGTNVLEIAEL